MATRDSLPFPEAPPSLPSGSAERYWCCADRRSKWKSLHYRVVIPKTWRPVATPPHDSGPHCPQAMLGLFIRSRAIAGVRPTRQPPGVTASHPVVGAV
ncbi:MAG: hypothetical protein JW751_01540, partial [Polyangiaceae bacterium]|nr:hypothetical protein [Polyangiaceae bacterium]